MLDFYIKDALTDADYDETLLDEDNPLQIYLQELKMVLSNDMPILGAPDMLVGLDEMVFELNLNQDEIKARIFGIINKYCTFSDLFPTTVNVKFFNGTQRDICVIDINVDANFTLRLQIT